MIQLIWPAFPTLRSAQVLLAHVLLGQRPSLHNLRWRSPAFVRLLRRYYSAVRLPITVHVGLIAHRLLPPVRGLPPRTMTGLSVLARGVSMRAWGLRLRRVERHSRYRTSRCCVPDCRTPSAP